MLRDWSASSHSVVDQVEMSKPYVRLLRAADLQVIKDLHNGLFQFDIVVGDAALQDAVTNSRWLCLAAVQAQPGGGEKMAGFVMSAVAAMSDFQQGDYFEDSSDSPARDLVASEHVGSSTSSARSMGLQHLELKANDIVVNVCLLATLPEFRREGIASQLFAQVINSARNARAKAIFLHVLDGNEPALAFYRRFGFQVMARIPNFYQLSSTEAEQAAGYRDALLLRALVSEVVSPSSRASAASVPDVALQNAAAYRTAAQRAAAAGTAASPGSGQSSNVVKPAPKMRGLMGKGSGSFSTSTIRRPASIIKPSSPAASSNNSPPPSGSQSTQSLSSTSSSKSDGGSNGRTQSGMFGLLTGVFGSITGNKTQTQNQAGHPEPSKPNNVEVNGESLTVIEGKDGQVYAVTNDTAAETLQEAIAVESKHTTYDNSNSTCSAFDRQTSGRQASSRDVSSSCMLAHRACNRLRKSRVGISPKTMCRGTDLCTVVSRPRQLKVASSYSTCSIRFL